MEDGVVLEDEAARVAGGVGAVPQRAVDVAQAEHLLARRVGGVDALALAVDVVHGDELRVELQRRELVAHEVEPPLADGRAVE